MKKALSIILASVMLIAMSCAGADLDYSTMTDSELQKVVDSARTELFSRKQKEENGNLVVVDKDGIQLTLTGETGIYPADFLRFYATIVNGSDKTVSVFIDKAYINGWEVYGGIDAKQTEPGRKVKARLSFDMADADIASIDEIEDITFRYSLYDSNASRTFWEGPEMQLFIDGDRAISVQEITDIG